MSVRVVIVEDHPLMQQGLASALGEGPGIEVVGRADTAGEGLRLVGEHGPDVVVLDLRLPDEPGVALIERLREEAPEVRALVVTANEQARAVLDAVAAGAAGYLTKRSTPEEIRHAVFTVSEGGSVVSPSLAGHLLREYSGATRRDGATGRMLLTARERKVLRLVAEGATDRQVAETLHLSVRTVQNELAAIRRKTGARRRAELAIWAAEHSL